MTENIAVNLIVNILSIKVGLGMLTLVILCAAKRKAEELSLVGIFRILN